MKQTAKPGSQSSDKPQKPSAEDQPSGEETPPPEQGPSLASISESLQGITSSLQSLTSTVNQTAEDTKDLKTRVEKLEKDGKTAEEKAARIVAESGAEAVDTPPKEEEEVGGGDDPSAKDWTKATGQELRDQFAKIEDPTEKGNFYSNYMENRTDIF